MRAFRVLKPDDARELAMLHARAFDIPWSPAALRSELAKPSVFGLGLIAPDAPDELISFVLFQRALDEAEMLTLATDPDYQKRGHAKALLKAAFESLKERGVARSLLDVAANNPNALALYQQAGFSEDGRRKDYYKQTGQGRTDAILMSFNLTGL